MLLYRWPGLGRGGLSDEISCNPEWTIEEGALEIIIAGPFFRLYEFYV